MTVRLKRKRQIMGQVVEMSQYEPGQGLTRVRREKADLLDVELKKYCSNINDKFDILSDDIKKNELKKWRWLGERLEEIIKGAKNLEMNDVDNHHIWPAIGQYLRGELKRGYETKRSGTKKDHYRKCWLLAKLPNLNWIQSWGGWDAFVDRGDQIVTSQKIMPAIGNALQNAKLKTRDYQKLAKNIVNQLPSGAGRIVDLDSMSDEKIKNIVEDVCGKFLKELT
jgi:hypothetical protein